jgi:hypothetical protein
MKQSANLEPTKEDTVVLLVSRHAGMTQKPGLPAESHHS